MDHRTWGDTRNCKGCRYWSEMIAASDESGIKAMCLNWTSRNFRKFTAPVVTCDQWRDGSLGAVDDPGGNPYQG